MATFACRVRRLPCDKLPVLPSVLLSLLLHALPYVLPFVLPVALRCSKLFPLTEKRALPAIPVAGVYRLIDIPISNLINSGINKMWVVSRTSAPPLLVRLRLPVGTNVHDQDAAVVGCLHVAWRMARMCDWTVPVPRPVLAVLQPGASQHTMAENLRSVRG